MTVLALCVIRGNSNFTQYRRSISGICITCLTHTSTSSSFSSASLSDICYSVSPCFTLFICSSSSSFSSASLSDICCSVFPCSTFSSASSASFAPASSSFSFSLAFSRHDSSSFAFSAFSASSFSFSSFICSSCTESCCSCKTTSVVLVSKLTDNCSVILRNSLCIISL